MTVRLVNSRPRHLTSGQTLISNCTKPPPKDHLPVRHWERVSGNKYYGSHFTGDVLLCDGFPVFHGESKDVSEFIELNHIVFLEKGSPHDSI